MNACHLVNEEPAYVIATTSALDPPGRDNFLDFDNKELAALNSLPWSKLFFSMNSL